MTQDSLSRTMRANAGRLLVISTLFLAVLVALGLMFGPSMRHSIRGPLHLSQAELIAGIEDRSLAGELVAVTGSDVADAGLLNGNSGRPVGELGYLTVGDRLLAVRSDGSMGTTFEGIIGALPDAEAKEAGRVGPVARAQMLPLALDAAGHHRLRGQIGAALLAVAGVFTVLMWFVNALTVISPVNSRTMRRLRKRYGADGLRDASDQLGQTHIHLGHFHLTRHWMIGVQTNDRFIARPMSELVWCYRKIVTSKVLGVFTTGRKHIVTAVWADGKRSSFGFDDEESSSAVTAAVTKFAPWAASGYTKELQTMWSKRREELVDSVAARRARHEQLNVARRGSGVVWQAPDGADARAQAASEPVAVPRHASPVWESIGLDAALPAAPPPVPTPPAAPVVAPSPAPVVIETPPADPLERRPVSGATLTDPVPPVSLPTWVPVEDAIVDAPSAPSPDDVVPDVSSSEPPEPDAAATGPRFVFEPMPLDLDGGQAW